MKKKALLFRWWVLPLCLSLILGNGYSPAVAVSQKDDQPATIYLPLVFKNSPRQPTVFGVEINRGTVVSTVARAGNARVSWVRYNGIQWDQIEAVQGVYDWSALAQVEADILLLRQKGLEPQIIVRGAPAWAQKIPGKTCGAIAEDALDDFAAFLTAVVNRLHRAPYQIQYWELGNEPDVDPTGFDSTMPYGCWGDKNDPYYGGEYYGTMLSYASPAIKQADPQAQVILGGLLLICDPGNPPAGNPDGCLPAKFLEGILRNGGGQYIDIIAYHSYPYYYNPDVNRDWELTQPFWQHRGGILLGKLDYIQALLAQYGVGDKQILANEAGLVCGWNLSDPRYEQYCLTDTFRYTQANYVPRLYARSWAHGLTGSLWYTLNGSGWRECGLLDDNQEPRPAYNVYAYLAQLLEGASYLGQLSSGTLEGYEFVNSPAHRAYRLYWSNDSTLFTLPKPAGTIGVYDQFGNDMTPISDTLTISFDPITIVVIAQP